MRQLLVFGLLLALVGSGTALAARGEPQKRINAADQTRARAMLLRKSDLDPSFVATQASGGGGEFYCAAIDESDLTLTGEARAAFVELVVSVASSGAVYESVADANAAWRRETSAAGTKCVQGVLRREFAKGGLRFVSFRRTSFPPLAQKSIAYRIVLSGQLQGVVTPFYIDVVALQHSRGQAALFFAAAVRPVELSTRRRLAKVTAARMAKAMGG